MTEPGPLTLGTAGHVDHGKTALVRALTGIDTDRLKEEKERGLSIALGYAPLELPSGRRLSLVDVPGHERFVRTMVAGATGIDLFLLCVAADDGVMPQTREHVAVLRALGVKRGVMAITKSDLADPELAIDEASELLPGVETVPVAAPTRAGLDPLLAALDGEAAAIAGRSEADGPVRLHVDRSFTVKGIGTIVTGTLWSGRFAARERVRVLPEGREVRIRSIQVHGTQVDQVLAGQRVALALAGIGRREVRRGDVICGHDRELRATYALEASIALDPGAAPLDRGARVQIHHGTRETAARISPQQADRVEPGSPAVCRLRLEAPLIAYPGDRLVVRQIAPPNTVGGGEVLDTGPRKRREAPQPIERPHPPRRAEPPPLGDAEARLAGLLHLDGERPRADGELQVAAGLEAPTAARAWRALERAGLAVRTGPNLHFHREPLQRLVERVAATCRREGSVTIASVRDELGTSRRYAQALLEHLDAVKVTIRHGDRHVIRTQPTGGSGVPGGVRTPPGPAIGPDPSEQ
ncbi:MAG TPA: selenocysteine-specific translation elongation factor [Thermoleophilaceae bacterium]|nr:selenocysteine-specific translation elongation factor [Thermoleophilaceae bacterium]